MKKLEKHIAIVGAVRELLVLAALLLGAILLRWAAFMTASL